MVKEAYLLVNVEAGREKEILKDLKKSKDVEAAYILFGPYDIIVKLKCDDKHELDSCVNNLKSIDGVGEVKILEVADVGS